MKINPDFLKRLKSLLWRTAMLGLAFMVAFLAENIVGLGLDPTVTTFLGLILGEVSKHLNKQIPAPEQANEPNHK